jgi:hypothetical protein
MFIPGGPVRRPFQFRILKLKEVLQKPFPFLSGEQAVFSCARMALLYGIQLLDYLPRKAHIPIYCCRSVLSPFEKLGIEIRFYDVDRYLKPVIDNSEFSEGDIFLLVHYFGIPQNILSIDRLCREFGMVLVEDCAHALPDPEAEYPMGARGVFSVYSLRKQLPVLDGGILVVNDTRLRKRMSEVELPRLQRMLPKTWLTTKIDCLAFIIGWPNLIHLRDIQGNKVESTNLSDSTDDPFYMYLSDNAVLEINRTTARVLGQIDIGAITKTRRKNYHYLAKQLSGLQGVTTPFTSLPDGAVPQAFPVLLKDSERVCTLMRKKGIGVFRWPGPELIKHISPSDFPGAFLWTKSLILLPIHQDLNTSHIEKIVEVLRRMI